MEPEHAEYWRATDQVIDLARDYILRPESVTPDRVDSFLDYRAGFLIRVVNNLATAGYLQIAEQLAFNHNPVIVEKIIPALLYPLDVFAVVPTAGPPKTQDTEKGIYWGVTGLRQP